MTARHLGARRAGQGGFTMIEVLIAIVVMSIGLLGFALSQTMNVRVVQSANFRTQATNLSYELLDQIRINRVAATTYVGSYAATTKAADCTSPIGAKITKDQYMTDWRCRLGKALGDEASAKVTRSGDEVTVSVSWGDERWLDAADTTFAARTQL